MGRAVRRSASNGSTNVNDYFMEASVPLVQGKTGVEQLAFDTAYRKSDYSSGIETDTYKFGVEYAPLEDVRFRASYQRAARAPNIVELFTAQGFNLFDLDGDPCGAELNGKAGAASDDACLNSGPGASVTPSQLRGGQLDSPAGQYNFNQGGNPDLDPEESDTISYGIVFTPRFAPGLSMSLDYFDIEVEDLISTFGAPTRWMRATRSATPGRAAAFSAMRQASSGSARATSTTSTSTSAVSRPPASTSISTTPTSRSAAWAACLSA